ncbi:MAG: hypothetical protein A2068_14190 [Ignavibacteria bacterium GWB2_35_6b]|nr:MAG: hypothetical protein A2068_14190 [Ignavibacteria bacterium GWB2_35_6b]
MENNKSTKEFVIGIFSLIFVLSLLLLFINGCEQNDSIVGSNENSALNESFKKIVEDDEVVQSFEPNFTESEAMDFLGKTNTVIYPAHVWQKIETINFDLAMTVEGDTAYGVSTKTYTGTLFIAAAYNDSTDEDSTDGDDDSDDEHDSKVDTVIQKPFTAVITRNIIFEKVDTTGDTRKDWKILAISLPEGGTGSPNIFINKLTVILANGDSIEVTSPNEYYVSRDMNKKWGYRGNHGPGGYWKHGSHNGLKLGFGFGFLSQFFSCRFNERVHLRVEVESAYADEEYTAVTFGADRFGKYRTKTKFELVSSEFNGTTYNKVYEGEFKPKGWKGFYHAIIHAVPYHVVNDDGTPVEAVSWGIPYKVE